MTATSAVPIDVRLKPAWVAGVGYRYDVVFDGEVIVRRARDPEYDAARVLHAHGLHGIFRTTDFNTGKPRMILDIGKAARLRTIEREDAGPTVVPYRPMSDDEKTRARSHRAHHGRLLRGRVAPDTGEAAKAAGDESGVGLRWVPATSVEEGSSILPPEPPDGEPSRLEAEDA